MRSLQGEDSDLSGRGKEGLTQKRARDRLLEIQERKIELLLNHYYWNRAYATQINAQPKYEYEGCIPS